jgi:ATP phosphoribosyltransferase regulatory subunit HisZ
MATATSNPRAQRLGRLLAATQMPEGVRVGISEALPRMNLLQVDLLIDALSREQREWDRLEEILFEAERDVEGRLSTVSSKQTVRAAELVDKVADAAEAEESVRIRRHLTGGG